MGMSTHVYGYLSPDNDDYRKHSAVLKACIDAGVKLLPKETAEYFGGGYVDSCLLDEKLEIEIPKHKYSCADACASGYEIYVKDIPKSVHKIRFCNSY